MIKRQQDRRQLAAPHVHPALDQRRAQYDRRGQDPVDVLPGATRPAVNEAAPTVERRRVPGATE